MSIEMRRTDPRVLPAYTTLEVAHYLAVPPATVRYWALGRDRYVPLIVTPKHSPALLSFLNLAELHILASIRRVHAVKMPSIRKAIRFLKKRAQSPVDRKYPLLSRDLDTDGVDLFIEEYGSLINISKSGQMAMREIIGAALSRIERDPEGIPVKLYPFTRADDIKNAPAMIVIDPNLSAGRPVIVGTGLAVQLIAERYKAGESINDLAQDYERSHEEIEEAVRCELPAAA
ncbi:MAG: DUF433 domain-containing protein [Gammaproteobacteria bacterium]|nr:DUF433 domain-containing protein [Gammaproteobacteria bacterium]MDE0302458.1 DUF433 domain-containing protein [Gammaproteobacteria bacterium]MDE0611907.1 DUF433 domain-containing protein [Gammaproteobacteria bacterium]